MGLTNLVLDKLTTKRGSDAPLTNEKYCLFLDGEDEVMADIVIMELDVMESSKIMTSPTESGTIIADHRVFIPIEITARCTLPIEDWKKSYDALRAWFEQTEAKFLTLATKADNYENMQLIELPHKETSESIQRLFFDLKFREVKLVAFDYKAMPLEVVESAENATTVDAGTKQVESDLNKLGDAVRGGISKIIGGLL